MQPDASSNKSRDLRNLAFVIMASLCAAFFLTFFFIYNYGPSGQYLAKNVLLEPSLLERLNYNDTDPKTGGKSRFTFDSLEFTWYDEEQKAWKKLEVGKDKYAQFYQQFSDEVSIKNPSEDVVSQFVQPNAARLILRVKTESGAKWQATAKIFQETQFLVNGSYFRVELHEQTAGEHWAYFYHPQVYRDVMAIMVP